MFASITTFLKEPYPFYYEKRNLPWFLLKVFLFGTFFLYTFQPFSINWSEHKYSFLTICMVHSLTAILALLPVFLIADSMVPDKNSWTVYKEIGLISIGFFLVGVGNFLIRDYIYSSQHHHNWTTAYLWEEISNAFLIAIILYPIIIIFNNYRLKTKYTKEGQLLSPTTTEKSLAVASQKMTFLNSAGISELELTEEQFLFVKSDGNYITVYFKNQEQVEKKLIRSTLTALSNQYPHLFQPHRSYLVNLDKISRIGGNSQGYTLHFDNCDIAIPVSRNKKEALVKLRNV